MITQRTLLSSCLIVLATLSGAAAHAQARGDDSESQHNQGNRLREQGRHAEARDLFRALYERTHDPRALVRQGLAEMALQEWLNAAAHLEEGSAVQGNRWVDENRARIQGALREVQTHLGSLAIECSPTGAVVYLDNVMRATCPVAQPIRLAVGSVTVRVQAPGIAPVTETATVVAGDTPVTVRLALAAPVQGPSGDDIAAAESNNRRRSTMRALGFTGVALGVVGIGVGVAGYAISNDAGGPLSEPMGIAGLAAGGAFLVAGVVLLVAAPARREVPERRALACGPWLHAVGGGCAVTF